MIFFAQMLLYQIATKIAVEVPPDSMNMISSLVIIFNKVFVAEDTKVRDVWFGIRAV